MLRDLLFSFSFANLFFLHIWIDLIFLDKKQYYYFNQLPTADSYIAIILNVLLLGGVSYAIIAGLRRWHNAYLWRIFKISFGFLLLIPLNSVRPQLLHSSSVVYDYFFTPVVAILGKFSVALLMGIIGSIIIVVAFRHRKSWLESIVSLVTVLAPFALLTLSQALWQVETKGPEYRNEYSTSSISENDLQSSYIDSAAPRVLWLIFDEMDQRLTFEERLHDVQIPEFDRLRQESVVATQGEPPAGSTLLSIPSLLTGRVVVEAVPYGSDDLLLRYSGSSDMVKWSEQISIFSEAKKLSMKAALLGWYHPYGRILGHQLDFAKWYAGDYQEFSTNGIWQNMKSQIMSLFPTVNRQSFIKVNMTMQDETIDIVTNTQYNIMFVHLIGLHTPYTYDRHQDRYVLFRDHVTGYFDQMVLSDKILGRIRQAMEKQGLWDQTTVIVSADHWWRNSATYDNRVDHRVPFILKMAGQKETVLYEEPFNTVLTYDLVLSILRGEVKSASEATKWLDLHR